MKGFIQWLHMVVCGVSTVFLIMMACSPKVTKDLFVLALVVYVYIILLAVALFKEE